MKLKQLTAIALGAAFCAFSSCNDSKEKEQSKETDQTDKTGKTDKQEKPDLVKLLKVEEENAEAVFVVFVKGKGWGVGIWTRSVLEDQKGVKSIKLSGFKATVFVEPGTTLNRAVLKQQFKNEGITFVSAEASVYRTPTIVYSMEIDGTSWTETADKVRVALEKFNHIAAVYIDDTSEIHLTEDVPPTREALIKAFDPIGVELLSMEKGGTLNL